MHEPLEDNGPPSARRLKITKFVISKYGYTEGCPQCIHCEAFGEHKQGLAHTERCRERIVKAMRSTTEGAARLEDIRVRLERSGAQKHEHDTRKQGGIASASPPDADVGGSQMAAGEQHRHEHMEGQYSSGSSA